MKRKGWHRKKRRMHHDLRQQYANTLWNCIKRMREDAREHSRRFEAWMVKVLTEAAERNAGPRPATD